MLRLERKHSLVTRTFQWNNAPVLAVMIYSGLLIYWANGVYATRLRRITLLRFAGQNATLARQAPIPRADAATKGPIRSWSKPEATCSVPESAGLRLGCCRHCRCSCLWSAGWSPAANPSWGLY